MDHIEHPAPDPASEPARGPAPFGDRAGRRGAAPGAEDVLAIRTAEDILAYIPHALGEWPEESLVAVCLGDGHLGATLRIDLPVRRGPAALRRFSDTVADYLLHDRPHGAVLAVYTGTAWTEPSRPPQPDVVDAVVERLALDGLPVLEVWVVGTTHWRTATCTDTSCCPWPGASVESLRMSRIEAEMVYRGSTYGPRDPDGKTRGGLPSSAVAAALDACVQDPERWWDPYAFTAALAAWDDVLSETAVVGAERLRLLAATLARPALRDAVLVAAAADAATAWRGSAATAVLRGRRTEGTPPALPGGVTAAEAAAALDCWSEDAPEAPPRESAAPEDADSIRSGVCGDSVGARATSEFGLVLMGGTGAAPAWDRIARLEGIAQNIAQMEEPEVRAPALSVLAWIQWARGRGGRCVKLLERALSADPEYRLAHLLLGFVEHGELPGWARSRETAWHRRAEAA